ncbi:MAG: ribonuclease P protein component [Prevotellaceae bacterium]|jgi:ribonuclease P protein component|nr:ribonuclease P protein component [Prevotellaceae bacterium]
MSAAFSFSKKQRLTGETRIAKLFAEGKGFIVYPLRIIYLPDEKTDVPLRLLVSVPKKRFKRAVKRNLLKRRIREAFRLNRHNLEAHLADKDYTLNVAINYVSNEMLSFAEMEEKLIEALRKLEEKE